MVLTEGTAAGCAQAPDLIADAAAQRLLAGRGYDSDALAARAEAQGMEAVMPPR